MDNVSMLDMSKEDAEKAYKDYLQAVKGRKEKYLEDLKQVYFNLKQGKKVIDVFEVMQKAGTNMSYEPKLAISRAGFPIVYFLKQASGSGSFGNKLNESWYSNKWLEDRAGEQINLPSGTFENWPTELDENKQQRVMDKVVKTKVPIVPAHLLPNGKLENYYILWEAREWAALPPKKDPFLLRRLSTNLFVVLAEWELTAIEQAVIRGQQ